MTLDIKGAFVDGLDNEIRQWLGPVLDNDIKALSAYNPTQADRFVIDGMIFFYRAFYNSRDNLPIKLSFATQEAKKDNLVICNKWKSITHETCSEFYKEFAASGLVLDFETLMSSMSKDYGATGFIVYSLLTPKIVFEPVALNKLGSYAMLYTPTFYVELE